MPSSRLHDSSATLAHAVRELFHEPPVEFRLHCDHVLQRFQRGALVLVQSTTTTERRERMSNGPAATICCALSHSTHSTGQTKSWTRERKSVSMEMEGAMESTFIHKAGAELSRCLLCLFVRKRDQKSKLFVPIGSRAVWTSVVGHVARLQLMARQI